VGIDPQGEDEVALLPLIVSFALAIPPQRWDDALAKANGEGAPIERARARVEVLYGAGDLPGALAEARAGLSLDPDDLALLRRVCQLEAALRDSAGAAAHLERLVRALGRASPDPGSRSWWETEVAALTREVELVLEHAREADAAIARARAVSFAVLGLAVVAILVLGLASRSAGTETKPPASG
jgi:hypothetical protein